MNNAWRISKAELAHEKAYQAFLDECLARDPEGTRAVFEKYPTKTPSQLNEIAKRELTILDAYTADGDRLMENVDSDGHLPELSRGRSWTEPPRTHSHGIRDFIRQTNPKKRGRPMQFRTLAGYQFASTHMRVDQLTLLSGINESQLKRYFAGQDCLTEDEVRILSLYLASGQFCYIKWQHERAGEPFNAAATDLRIEQLMRDQEDLWQTYSSWDGVTLSEKYGRVVLSKEFGAAFSKAVQDRQSASSAA
jgi:hypothetical protein